MADDRKITVAEGVEDREALRESIAKKLAKPTIYRSIDIDVKAEGSAIATGDEKVDELLAKADDLPVDISELAQKVASSLKKDPQAIHYHYDSEDESDEAPESEDAYKAMLKGMGFNV